MRLLLLLLLLPFTILGQCPDPVSILKYRIPSPPVISPWPIGIMPPYAYPTIGWTINLSSSLPKIPPINNDPKTGKKIWKKNGECLVYDPVKEQVLLAAGKYANGKKTGKWTWFYDDSTVRSTGNYYNGLKSGLWIEYSENQYTLDSGKYINGRKEGEWLSRYTETNYVHGINKKKISLIHYHLGLYHSSYRLYENDVQTAQHNYKMGVQNGAQVDFFSWTDSVGKPYIRKKYYSLNGKLHGKTKEFNVDGKLISEETYANGSLNGKSTRIDPDNNIKTISNYFNNSLHGWQTVYQDEKLIEKTRYFNNQKNGLHLKVNDDYKYIEHYKKDNYHGTVKTYRKEDGKWILEHATRYNNGLLDSIEYYCVNNQVRRTPFVKGKRDGISVFINDGVDTTFMQSFKKDIYHGKNISTDANSRTEYYYNNGKLISEIRFTRDRSKKLSEIYYRNGYPYNKEFAQQFPNGKLVIRQPDQNGNIFERILSAEGANPDTSGIRITDKEGKLMQYYIDISKTRKYSLMLNNRGDTIFYFDKITNSEKYISHALNVVYKGTWKDGKRYGSYELLSTKGKTPAVNTGPELLNKEFYLAARGEYYADEPFGQWTYYDSTGSNTYSGCHCGIIPSGWIDFHMYEGYHRTASLYSASGHQLIPFQGKVCGDFTFWFPSGKVAKTKKGKLYTEYYENGNVKTKGEIISEMQEGTWEFYDEQGNVSTKKFVQGYETPQ